MFYIFVHQKPGTSLRFIFVYFLAD